MVKNDTSKKLQKHQNFEVSNLRLWGDNPRYTNFKNVKILDIGKQDYEIQSQKDIYNINLINSYKMLCDNSQKIKKLYELVENIIKGGFDTDADEILVTLSPELIKIDGIKYQDTYYVLEGNRRLFAIHLINDFNRAREVLKREIGEVAYKNFEKLFYSIKESIINIECKIFNVLEKGEKHTWKTLNSRHFGNRKGKLNWPRGTVLNIIDTKVRDFRKDNFIDDNLEISQEQYDNMIIELESYTGKKISQIDLLSALWSTTVIKIYNSNSKSKEITFENTDEELESRQEDSNYSNEKTETDKKLFSISSLELAPNTIKIINDIGEAETLKEKISLLINPKKWTVEHSLSKEIWKNLAIYLVEAIKNKKLNTRVFKEEYATELLSILSEDTRLSNKTLNTSNDGKINFDQITFLGLKNISVDNIKFATKEEKIIYDQFINLMPEVDDIIKLILFLDSKLSNITNKYIYSLLYVWCKEFKPLILSKSYLQPIHYPYFSIASLLRSTSELLCNLWVILDLDIQNMALEEFSKKAGKYKIKTFNHIFEQIKNNNFNEHVSEQFCKYCEGKKFIQYIDTTDLKFKIAFEKFIINLENSNNSFVKSFYLKYKKQIDLEITQYVTYIKWAENTDILNRLIHKNHYIYDLVNENITPLLIDELKKNFQIIIRMLTWFKMFIIESDI
ncbi:hypothetical protein SSYRP_v1c02690 [Spiroplasma syrphidicola EA-1]|uniref:Uncharacterized protein n=1 Tax=Spiroplasma syrphidicola EA-1 TaxID=1276229 RepID=R4UI87_9MOLU|nr:hypothetical protein [Spiroplasma syrphidicola]AGM25865.1 hypothetical protein SSYRP_v1c02690 [Spiroplasma syrphidicola EA-1]